MDALESKMVSAIPPGWNYTDPYPGRSPIRLVVVFPPAKNMTRSRLDFLMFRRRFLFENTSTVD